MSLSISTRNSNSLLPDSALPKPAPEPLTKYGFMRLSFLKEHRPVLYNQLLLAGQLNTHLGETQRVANERIDTLMAQLTKRDPPPDKATDNLAWAAHMNALKHSAEEIVLNELIYD